MQMWERPPVFMIFNTFFSAYCCSRSVQTGEIFTLVCRPMLTHLTSPAGARWRKMRWRKKKKLSLSIEKKSYTRKRQQTRLQLQRQRRLLMAKSYDEMIVIIVKLDSTALTLILWIQFLISSSGTLETRRPCCRWRESKTKREEKIVDGFSTALVFVLRALRSHH